MVNCLAKLCSSDLWKVEVKSDGLGYLAEYISKQSNESMSWFLIAYSKRK